MTADTSPRTRLLIVDDDSELVDMLEQYLEREGFETHSARDGHQALSTLAAASFDLLILDVMLPGKNGLELLRHITPQYPKLAVIMLTARGDAVDRIVGLELGADDYLPKPFDPRELSARIRAILRRRALAAGEPHTPASEEPAGGTRLGTLHLDLARKQALTKGKALPLTAAEFRVLHCLLQSPATPVDRETLTLRALGRKLALYDRSVDTHVSNLRRKLELGGVTDVLIQSVRGAGYEIVERPE